MPNLIADNTIKSNQKVSRSKFLDKLRQFPEGSLIAMEACGTAHYWGRLLQNLGYQVRLIPAQHVKPFVSNQKNDANEALAICEAPFRPRIHSVPVKTVEQQDIKSLRCVRTRMVQNRTAIVNQIRSLASEYGVTFPVGHVKLQSMLVDVLENAENELSFVLRRLLKSLYKDLNTLTNYSRGFGGEILRGFHQRNGKKLKVAEAEHFSKIMAIHAQTALLNPL